MSYQLLHEVLNGKPVLLVAIAAFGVSCWRAVLGVRKVLDKRRLYV